MATALRGRHHAGRIPQVHRKDAALERRFQKILVGEPTVEATIAILRGLQEKYELHHGWDITDPAIVAAAELSNRYITDRFLPDKAIDLIDEAAAKIKIEIDSKPEAIDKLDRRMIQLQIEREAVKKEKDEASQKRLTCWKKRSKSCKRKLPTWKTSGPRKAQAQGSQQVREQASRKVKQQIEELKRKGDFNKVAELQYGKLPDLERQLKPQAKEEGGRWRVHPQPPAAHPGGRGRNRRGGEPRHGHPVAKMMQGEKTSCCRWKPSCTSAWWGRKRRLPPWPTPSAARVRA